MVMIPFYFAKLILFHWLTWMDIIWFKTLFGLKINLRKSEIFHIGEIDNIEDLVAKLGWLPS